MDSNWIITKHKYNRNKHFVLMMKVIKKFRITNLLEICIQFLIFIINNKYTENNIYASIQKEIKLQFEIHVYEFKLIYAHLFNQVL